MSHDLLRPEGTPGRHHFIATGDAASFEVLARRFLGPEVIAVEHVEHVAAHYPTGSMARITPEMVAAARAGAQAGPKVSPFAGASGQYNPGERA